MRLFHLRRLPFLAVRPLPRAVGACLVGCIVLVGGPALARDLPVGPGQRFSTIAEALARARPGDTVLVHARADDQPYERVALLLRKPRITIRAVGRGGGRARVRLSGAGFDYSGVGSTPRAIVQFNPGADGCVLTGFELSGAHNRSHNGAGIRINQANDVVVRDCEIHGCDMGVMSNGDGTDRTAVNQRFESCLIHDNGDRADPGYNHDLYLGGTSVTLTACEVHSSLTGHNIKSRAHFTRVEYCYVHDSANREFDLVDAKGDTTVPGSDAVLIGDVIVKDPKCPGNRATIHFGQDGGHGHDGTLWLVNDTIVTPFRSPVVDLSSPNARVKWINDIVWGMGGRNQTLVRFAGKATPDRVTGSRNWLSTGFRLPAGLDLARDFLTGRGTSLPFADPAKRDYHLGKPVEAIVGAGVPFVKIRIPATPGAAKPDHPVLEECRFPLGIEPRPLFRPDAPTDLGAFACRR